MIRSLMWMLAVVIGVGVAEAKGPNVVVILSDDQAWTDYGFMGHEQIKTPHLDKLAKESLTFARGYVPASLCRPSLATLVTGLYPHQHLIVGNDPAPPKGTTRNQAESSKEYRALREKLNSRILDQPRVPQLLGEAGYISFQSGKWWEGNFSQGGFTQGMTRGFPQPGGRHGDDGLKIGRNGMEPVLKFIDQAAEADKPFFLWYAPMMPHQPHNPPQRLLDKYLDKSPSKHVATYWAMCDWFDETCGQLLDHLDQKGLKNDTLVVYVCDNGWIQQPDKATYDDRSKRSRYDGGTRTPIMLRWPGHVTPKMDRENLASSIDLAPTILQACGLKPSEAMQGINLLDEKAVSSRHTLFGEIFDHDVPNLDDPTQSLQDRWCIQDYWKMIVPNPAVVGRDQVELYDLKADPHEKKNLAAGQPQRVAEMQKQLDTWWMGK